MRTTLTLDTDLWMRLKELAEERSVSFKEILNSTLRAGLAAAPPAVRPFKVRARPMGVRPGIDLNRALLLADTLEAESLMPGPDPGN